MVAPPCCWRLCGSRCGRAAEAAIADVVESGAMPVIGAGFRDNVDHGAAGAALLGAISVGRNAKLSHDFIGKLVGRAIEAAGLGKEGIIKIAAVNEKAVLKSA